MYRQFLQRLLHELFVRVIVPIERHFKRCLQPATIQPTLGAVVDVSRIKSDLIVENAFLRQQLVILRRQTKRPTLTPLDRGLLVMFASRLGDVEERLAHRQARYPAQLASARFPLVLATQVESATPFNARCSRSHRAHPLDGARQSTVGH